MTDGTGDIGPRTAEHLERIFAEAFKREFDQEENVARTLPFFATALGTILGSVGLLRSVMDPGKEGVSSSVVGTSMVAALVACCLVIAALWLATRQQRTRIPAGERDMLRYAVELTAYNASDGQPDADLRTLHEVRTIHLGQLASATEAIRRSNQRRSSYRFVALSFLSLGLMSILLALGAMFLSKTP